MGLLFFICFVLRSTRVFDAGKTFGRLCVRHYKKKKKALVFEWRKLSRFLVAPNGARSWTQSPFLELHHLLFVDAHPSCRGLAFGDCVDAQVPQDFEHQARTRRAETSLSCVVQWTTRRRLETQLSDATDSQGPCVAVLSSRFRVSHLDQNISLSRAFCISPECHSIIFSFIRFILAAAIFTRLVLGRWKRNLSGRMQPREKARSVKSHSVPKPQYKGQKN